MRRWRPLVLATGFCGLVGWSASAQTLTEEQALTRMRNEREAQVRIDVRIAVTGKMLERGQHASSRTLSRNDEQRKLPHHTRRLTATPSNPKPSSRPVVGSGTKES